MYTYTHTRSYLRARAGRLQALRAILRATYIYIYIYTHTYISISLSISLPAHKYIHIHLYTHTWAPSRASFQPSPATRGGPDESGDY